MHIRPTRNPLRSMLKPRAGAMALLLALACVALGPAGCSCPTVREVQVTSRPARINHVVLFKLKKTDDADELIHDCDTMLGTLPGVASYFAGKHLDVGRTNVDGDYDVGFYVGFDSQKAYRAYVEHPLHIQVVEKWKSRWEWIRVHDILDPTP